MLQSWDDTATWNTFGGDGTQPDDVEARSDSSFNIFAPRRGNIFEVDVTEDVQHLLSQDGANEGWDFITDSNGG